MDEVLLTAWYAVLDAAVAQFRAQFPHVQVTGGGELWVVPGQVSEWEAIYQDEERSDAGE